MNSTSSSIHRDLQSVNTTTMMSSVINDPVSEWIVFGLSMASLLIIVSVVLYEVF